MRLAFGLFALVVALAACTVSPLDGMNRIAASGETETFPANYRDLLRHHFGLKRPLDLEISSPRPLLAANAFDPARWYVCVRTNSGAETIHVISRGKLEGSVRVPATSANAEPPPNICQGGTYQPLG